MVAVTKRVITWAGEETPPPDPQDNTDALWEEYRKAGVLDVKTRQGTYRFLRRQNIKHMPLTVIFQPVDRYEELGSTIHFYYGSGNGTWGEIAYAITFDGTLSGSYPGATEEACFRTVMQFIQSGRRMELNECGSEMSIREGR